MGKNLNGGELAAVLVVGVVVLLIVSYVFMQLWNRAVKKAFKDGAIKKIKYETAVGLVLFISIFFSTVVVTQAAPLTSNLHAVAGTKGL